MQVRRGEPGRDICHRTGAGRSSHGDAARQRIKSGYRNPEVASVPSDVRVVVLDAGAGEGHRVMTWDLGRMAANLPTAWAGFLHGWDRSLRSGNYPLTTRYNYLLAAVQLARYLVDHQPDGQAAHTPTAVTRQQIEAFQAWMVETRCASTALNKHKALQQFFK